MYLSSSSLLTYNQRLFLDKKQPKIDKFLSQIPHQFSLSDNQSELFEFYLYQSYGINLDKKISPAIACFVNASCSSYAGEENDICGDIELSPVVVRSSGHVDESLPPGADTVSMGDCRLLLDSGAFSEVKGHRISPAESLDRQLNHLESMFSPPRETWLASYDRLIDEKVVDGKQIKLRWSESEANSAVRETVEAARYLDSQRSRLSGQKIRIIQGCQGVSPSQYQDCVEKILPYCRGNDVVGLGGWCILGLQKHWLSTFWETVSRVIPLIADFPVKRVHIFGVTWFRPQRGYTHTPLGSLLWLCDKYGLELSCDGKSPIINSLQKFDKGASTNKAGAFHPYWRVNLALVRTFLASLRESNVYQPPPNFSPKNEKHFTISPKPKWKSGDRVYHPEFKIFAEVVEQVDCKQTKDLTYLVRRECNGVEEIWSEANCQPPPCDTNQMLLFSLEEMEVAEPPDPDDFRDLDAYNRAFAAYFNRSLSQLEDKQDWQDEDFKNLEEILSQLDSSQSEFVRGSSLLRRKSRARKEKICRVPEPLPENFSQIGRNSGENSEEICTGGSKSSENDFGLSGFSDKNFVFSGKPISFGKTITQLLSGNKTVTRRLWKDNYAKRFVDDWNARPGEFLYPALTKSYRCGGERVGYVCLTHKPYQEKLLDIPTSDLVAEGFPDLSKEKFIEQFFGGDDQLLVWVIWFVFFPGDIEEVKKQIYECQSQSSKVGRPKGSKNKQKSRGSFYMRGVSKKGVEQWSYHYHLLLPNGRIKKSSVSVPLSKLQGAKDVARLGGVEEVLRFLKGKNS